MKVERNTLNEMVSLQLKKKLSKDEKSTLKAYEKKFNKHKKALNAFVALEKLRKDMVITTGDNYVASAEPELREKMSELYSNVASNYDEVSGSYMQNYELISDEFEEAKSRLQSIKENEVEDFMNYLEKNQLDIPSLKSKEDFLSK